MKHVLPKKLILMPPIARYALVLVAAVALLLMATPGAFAASAHSASHASMKVRAVPNNNCPQEFPCEGIEADGQSTLYLNPNSNDCLTTPAGETVFECDITLSGFAYNSSQPPMNWTFTLVQLRNVNVVPSHGTLAPGQSVTVRIYPLSTLGAYNKGQINFYVPNQYAFSPQVLWNY